MRKRGVLPSIPNATARASPTALSQRKPRTTPPSAADLFPTLVLGIPGTPPDAIILGALLVQGIKVGPSLFSDQANIVYTFIYGLLIATILMLPAGLLLGRYAYQSIIATPKSMLVPVVALMTVIGSFAIHNNPDDIALMVILGVIGWLLDRAGFSPSPIVLGLVLGAIAEQGFVQAYLIGSAQNNLFGMYFGRPISLGIAIAAALTLFYPLVAQKWRLRKAVTAGAAAEQSLPVAEKTRDVPGMALAALFIALGAWVIQQTGQMSPLGSVFPRTIAAVMIACSLLLILDNLRRPAAKKAKAKKGSAESTPRRAGLVAVMAGWSFLIAFLGFLFSSMVAFVLLLMLAEYDRWTMRRALTYGVIGDRDHRWRLFPDARYPSHSGAGRSVVLIRVRSFHRFIRFGPRGSLCPSIVSPSFPVTASVMR